MRDRDQVPGDPTADVARLGIEAAANVVERMLEMSRALPGSLTLPLLPNVDATIVGDPRIDAAGDGAADPSVNGDGGDPLDLMRVSRQLRADAERLVELYASWTRALVDGAASLAERALATSGPAGAGAPRDELRVGPVGPGSTVKSAIWLHVLDGPATAPARLHATDLVAHDGSAISGSRVHSDPELLETEALRASSEVRVTIAVPGDIPAGTYHGHLLAEGLPEIVLALRVVVA